MRQQDNVGPLRGPRTPARSGSHSPNRKILVVDDDRHWLEGAIEILTRDGYDVRGVEGFPEGQVAIEQFEPDVLIVDVRLKGYNGLGLLLRYRERYPEIVALVVSGYDDPVIAREAKQAGAHDVLIKPIPGRILVERVGDALTSRGKRRWPRTPTPAGFTATIGGHQARILEVSYGGILVELPFVPEIGRLDVRLPMLDRGLTAQMVWTRGESPGVQLCGAALNIDDATTAAWRQVVDSMSAAGA